MDPLRHHGDVDATPGLLDFAVNVRGAAPPGWLRDRLAAALDDLARYPSAAHDAAAREAVAARHGRRPDEVLVLAGSAEGFALLPALRPRLAAVVHPGFTEPEAALRSAGVPVTRVLTDAADGHRLRPEAVPAEADLVVVGNPTNPTAVLHPAATLRALRSPGRVVLVDEAFADAVPGEAGSVAAEPGFLVFRSLTKTWALAGLRAGYALGAPDVLARLAAPRPPWPVVDARAGGRHRLFGAHSRGRGRPGGPRPGPAARRAGGGAGRGAGGGGACRVGRRSCCYACPTAGARASAPRCGRRASPSAAATRSPASAPTTCGSPSGTRPPSTASSPPSPRRWPTGRRHEHRRGRARRTEHGLPARARRRLGRGRAGLRRSC